jgi:hypothetical protein
MAGSRVKMTTKRVQPGKPPDFARMVDDLMSGKRTGRPGAEAAGFSALTALIEVYLLGEGRLADSLRDLVSALMKRDDPLRRDIPPELWAALFPTFNTLTHARSKALEQLAKAAPALAPSPPPEAEKNERREEEGGAVEGVEHAGAGLLRVGAGGVQ